MVGKDIGEKDLVENIEKSEENFVKNLRKNPWMASTFVFIVIAIILLVIAFRGGAMSSGAAGTKCVDFLNTMTGGGVSLVNISNLGSLYQVDVSYKGQDIPVYITKDGKYFVQAITPITENAASSNTTQATPKEVPKTDKPVVEAFVFAYCPYGLQFEKALLPVYNLLKNKADINIVFIGAMHGEYEHTESLRQLCIQKEYGKDMLFKYLDKFAADTNIGNCGSDTKCSDPLVEKIMLSLGIDKNKINTCMAKDAETLYQQDEARAQALGISGSPGFVINGVESQVSRSPDAIKQAICSAFNTVPSECSQTLSTTQASAGFGASAGSSGSSGSC